MAAATKGGNAAAKAGSSSSSGSSSRGFVAGFVAALLALAAAHLPPLDPVVTAGAPPHTHLKTANTLPLDTPAYTRRVVNFPCVDATCEAWLYEPKAVPGGGKAPVVVMGHGMGGQKDFGLHKYADAFASHGLAVFMFDYRGFGGSQGSPRHWVSARRHLADWKAAVRYVRANLTEAVDVSRLCLWGTSFAGGHVLVLAADAEFAPLVTAVSAQVPNLDARVSVKASLRTRGAAKSLRMLLAGLLDLLRTACGREPLYLPLAGPLGSMAFMQMPPDDAERYHGNHPTPVLGGWQNRARAAYAAEHAFFKTSPIDGVGRIAVPVLYVGAHKDTLCPMEVVERAAALTPRAEVLSVDSGHFELLSPPHVGKVVSRQLEFFLQHTGLAAAAAAEEEERAAAARNQVE